MAPIFFSSSLSRVESAITWLNQPDGPDYTTIFVPEQASDREQLRDFKYADIYDGACQKYGSAFDNILSQFFATVSLAKPKSEFYIYVTVG